jgi:hypothetical protein
LDKILSSNNLIKFIVTMALLSTLRNVTFAYHLFLMGGILLLALPGLKKDIELAAPFFLFALFLLYTFSIISWSFVYMGSFEPLPGVPRILLVLVITLILFQYIKNREICFSLINIILAIYVVAAASIVYQVFFGAITWFPEARTRGGEHRYASLLGSLTIYGSIVGYATIIILSKLYVKNSNKFSLILMLLIIILGTVLSLTKTGIVMILLASLIFFIFNTKQIIFNINFKQVIILFTIIFSIIIIAQNVPKLQSYYNIIVVQTFGADTNLANSNNVMIDSEPVGISHVWKRLTYWTSSMLEEYGNIVYFIGVGVIGGGGTLGMTEYGQAHNAFGDLFFIGGVPYLLLFLSLYFLIQFTLFKNRKDTLAKILLMSNILFLANMFIASGTVFHPGISLIFWISVIYANILATKNSTEALQPFPEKITLKH